jgi:outer membrane lipoprotein-sorting protein
MRWEYTRPEPKVALLSGGRALLYLPGDGQLIRGDPTWTSGPLLALLGGGAPLAEMFEAFAVGSAEEAERPVALRLVPRSKMEGFEEVTVTLDPGSFAIVEAEVLDEAGNRMRFEFRELRRNRGLADGLFVLVPPPGTEIIQAGE